jgi:hypothetical protein
MTVFPKVFNPLHDVVATLAGSEDDTIQITSTLLPFRDNEQALSSSVNLSCFLALHDGNRLCQPWQAGLHPPGCVNCSVT